VPHGISWVVNEGLLRPTADIVEFYKRIQVCSIPYHYIIISS
jgi:hypothetical protein